MQDGVNSEAFMVYFQKISQVQEEERSKIARELHDVTIQSLIAVLHQTERFLDENSEFKMSHLRFLLNLQEQIKTIIEELRYLSMNLRPKIVDHLGLVPAINHLANSLKNHNIAVQIRVLGPSFRFTPEVELTAFRIVQEAINNIIKHSNATKVRIIIANKEQELLIVIKDNGIGCEDYSQKLAILLSQSKLGIMGMVERSKIIGAEIKWDRAHNQGTVISLTIPKTEIILID